MNILILNWRDINHPLAGGAEISLFEHAKYWQKKGANVTWFAANFAGGEREERVEGIRIMRVGSHHSVHLLAFLYYVLGKLGKPDTIIDSFHFLPFFTPLYIKNAKIIGLINEVAGKVWFSNIIFPFSLIGYLVEPIFFAFYRKNIFITSSESTRSELIKLGIPLRNINMVYHGIVVKKISDSVLKEKSPIIIFLGRISEDKGIKDALEAFSIVAETVRNLKFWIVGREERRGYLSSLISGVKFEKLKSQIEYFNFIDEDKKFELLKKAWILIHPSKKEGWGLNVIEAGSQGTPAVGYNTEGLRDSIVNGKTGLLTDTNPEALGRAVRDLILDVGLYGRLRLGAMDWAGKFNWEKSNIKSWEIIRN